VIPTVPDQKYRLTFWFLYTGQGRIGDLNNCNRFGIDPGHGEWGTTDPNTGKKKFGFPATLRWWPDEPAIATGDPLHTLELAAECDRRAGGPGKGEGKWFRFSFDFIAQSAKTGIWFEAAASEFQRSRKYFDEISVVPVDE
jgi:hypothetical protein